ncbi:MAG: AEC family transporter [Colwellia sp.]
MPSSYFLALQFTFSITTPVFLIVFLGLYLKQSKRINDEFITIASKLIFNICLPLLLFLAIVDSEVNLMTQWKLASFSALATLLSFIILWKAFSFFKVNSQDKGVAVQSAFRSNLAIIGIALCTKAFGEEGLSVGAIIIAVVTPLYNILSIYALTQSLNETKKLPWGKLLVDIVKNPLIIGIALAFVFLALNWKLPIILNDTANYLSGLTLPLALITIGGSLSLSDLRKSSRLSSYVVLAKLVLLPLCITVCAWFLGFRGVELGCIALMFACPTAAASFVMAKAIGGNHQLASNTIAMSTLVSALTISLLLYLLRLIELA